MNHPKSILLLFKSIIIFCWCVNTSIAQTTLSEPYKIDAKGVVSSYKISPDGNSVVYLKRKNLMSSLSPAILGVSSIDNKSSIELDIDLSQIFINTSRSFRNINTYSISPDGKYVLYTVETSGAIQRTKLWSIPIGGGEAIDLSDDLVGLVSGGEVTHYEVSSDSNSVVYLSNSVLEDKFELFSIPITGGVRTRIDNNQSISEDVMPDFKITNRGEVIFRTAKSTDNASMLFKSPIAGGSLTQLNKNSEVLGEIFGFEISDNEDSLIYRANGQFGAANPLPHYLYYVPMTAGEATQISDIDTADDFKFSGNQWVVYRSGEAIEPAELYAVDITDVLGTTVTLSQGAGDLEVNENVVDFKVVPESNQVLYRVLRNDSLVQNSTFAELYSVNILNNTTVKLSGNDGFPNNIVDYQVSDGGNKVVYRALGALEDLGDFSYVIVSSVIEPKLFLVRARGVNVGYTSAIISDDGNHILAESSSIFNEDLSYFALNPADPNEVFKDLVDNDVALEDDNVRRFSFNEQSTYIVYINTPVFIIPIGDFTGSNLFAAKIVDASQDFCLPIKTGSGKVAIICL